ncbi:hypothetical protein DVH05_026809 [Phytophthora capsici]|nr:hypothetical protein DVH05_026809 [Phytophthora capsici]|eukprot:jgi/Phyca11/15519/fgenesh1_pg.PHYCAscaffold_14_\
MESRRQCPASWEKDGVEGGPSSVDIILKWITTAGNLQRWRGDTAGGKTKKVLAAEIADLIKKAGITGRFLQKVNGLQDSYNKAAGIERQSDEGILDKDEEKTFHDKLVSICKYWDTLEPIFHDRASSKPIAPTGTFNSAKPFSVASARSSVGGCSSFGRAHCRCAGAGNYFDEPLRVNRRKLC